MVSSPEFALLLVYWLRDLRQVLPVLDQVYARVLVDDQVHVLARFAGGPVDRIENGRRKPALLLVGATAAHVYGEYCHGGFSWIWLGLDRFRPASGARGLPLSAG